MPPPSKNAYLVPNATFAPIPSQKVFIPVAKVAEGGLRYRGPCASSIHINAKIGQFPLRLCVLKVLNQSFIRVVRRLNNFLIQIVLASNTHHVFGSTV